MDLKALQLNARFTLPPNSLGYCGKDSAPEKFKSCVINNNCDGVEEEFKHFIVMYPYLKTLAKITHNPKFSYKVIDSYWMGNNLLKKVKQRDYQVLLQNFKTQGVPDWLVKELKETPPKKFIPTHLFQVLHVGVGRASGSVPYNLETINNCMIRWGKVLKVGRQNLDIGLNSLKKGKTGFSLVQSIQSFPVIPGFVSEVKVGDTVTVHWKQVTKILDDKEVEKIEFWTNEVLNSINSQPKR